MRVTAAANRASSRRATAPRSHGLLAHERNATEGVAVISPRTGFASRFRHAGQQQDAADEPRLEWRLAADLGVMRTREAGERVTPLTRVSAIYLTALLTIACGTPSAEIVTLPSGRAIQILGTGWMFFTSGDRAFSIKYKTTVD